MRTPFIALILIAFFVNTLGPLPLANADDFHLPVPGTMVHLSPEFNPPVLKGIKVHSEDPFRFEFIMDKGEAKLTNQNPQPILKSEANKLIKYFLASITTPEKDLWVNLSPYEKDRIIPNSFGLTEMGRDLLAQDYMLKQITASLIYPEDDVGKKFWKRIYEEAAKKYGATNIPVNTFNKVWIVPEKAVVYENPKAGTAYMVESKLKVMLEQDYLTMNKTMSPPNVSIGGPDSGFPTKAFGNDKMNTLGSQIIREIVIPELAKEVNTGKNFAQLRQVYNSLILATWYKKKIKDSILAKVYADKNKTEGIGYEKLNPDTIYKNYLSAFKKGVYDYIKEEPDPITQQLIPHKYFSGGFGFDKASLSIQYTTQVPNDTAMKAMTIVNVILKIFEPPSILPWVKSWDAQIDDTFFVPIKVLKDDEIPTTPQLEDLKQKLAKHYEHWDSEITKVQEGLNTDSSLYRLMNDLRQRLMNINELWQGISRRSLTPDALHKYKENSLAQHNSLEQAVYTSILNDDPDLRDSISRLTKKPVEEGVQDIDKGYLGEGAKKNIQKQMRKTSYEMYGKQVKVIENKRRSENIRMQVEKIKIKTYRFMRRHGLIIAIPFLLKGDLHPKSAAKVDQKPKQEQSNQVAQTNTAPSTNLFGFMTPEQLRAYTNMISIPGRDGNIPDNLKMTSKNFVKKRPQLVSKPSSQDIKTSGGQETEIERPQNRAEQQTYFEKLLQSMETTPLFSLKDIQTQCQSFTREQGVYGFLQNILKPYWLALANADADEETTQAVLRASSLLGEGWQVYMQRLVTLYKTQTIDNDAFNGLMFEMRDYLIERGVFPFMFPVEYEGAPFVFLYPEPITGRYTLSLEELKRIRLERYEGQFSAIYLKGDNYPFHQAAGFTDGRYSIIFENLTGIPTATAPKAEQNRWTAWHELLHMIENFLFTRENIVKQKNPEAPAVLGPLIFSSYASDHLTSVVCGFYERNSQNDYYHQAARAVLNGLWLRLFDEKEVNLSLELTDEDSSAYPQMKARLSALSSERLNVLGAEIFLNKARYLKSTGKEGTYGFNDPTPLSQGLDGENPRSHVIKVRKSSISFPGITLQDQLAEFYSQKYQSFRENFASTNMQNVALTWAQQFNYGGLNYHEALQAHSFFSKILNNLGQSQEPAIKTKAAEVLKLHDERINAFSRSNHIGLYNIFNHVNHPAGTWSMQNGGDDYAVDPRWEYVETIYGVHVFKQQVAGERTIKYKLKGKSTGFSNGQVYSKIKFLTSDKMGRWLAYATPTGGTEPILIGSLLDTLHLPEGITSQSFYRVSFGQGHELQIFDDKVLTTDDSLRIFGDPLNIEPWYVEALVNGQRKYYGPGAQLKEYLDRYGPPVMQRIMVMGSDDQHLLSLEKIDMRNIANISIKDESFIRLRFKTEDGSIKELTFGSTEALSRSLDHLVWLGFEKDLKNNTPAHVTGPLARSYGFEGSNAEGFEFTSTPQGLWSMENNTMNGAKEPVGPLADLIRRHTPSKDIGAIFVTDYERSFWVANVADKQGNSWNYSELFGPNPLRRGTATYHITHDRQWLEKEGLDDASEGKIDGPLSGRFTGQVVGNLNWVNDTRWMGTSTNAQGTLLIGTALDDRSWLTNALDQVGIIRGTPEAQNMEQKINDHLNHLNNKPFEKISFYCNFDGLWLAWAKDEQGSHLMGPLAIIYGLDQYNGPFSTSNPQFPSANFFGLTLVFDDGLRIPVGPMAQVLGVANGQFVYVGDHLQSLSIQTHGQNIFLKNNFEPNPGMDIAKQAQEEWTLQSALNDLRNAKDRSDEVKAILEAVKNLSLGKAEPPHNSAQDIEFSRQIMTKLHGPLLMACRQMDFDQLRWLVKYVSDHDKFFPQRTYGFQLLEEIINEGFVSDAERLLILDDIGVDQLKGYVAEFRLIRSFGNGEYWDIYSEPSIKEPMSKLGYMAWDVLRRKLYLFRNESPSGSSYSYIEDNKRLNKILKGYSLGQRKDFPSDDFSIPTEAFGELIRNQLFYAFVLGFLSFGLTFKADEKRRKIADDEMRKEYERFRFLKADILSLDEAGSLLKLFNAISLYMDERDKNKANTLIDDILKELERLKTDNNLSPKTKIVMYGAVSFLLEVPEDVQERTSKRFLRLIPNLGVLAFFMESSPNYANWKDFNEQLALLIKSYLEDPNAPSVESFRHQVKVLMERSKYQSKDVFKMSLQQPSDSLKPFDRVRQEIEKLTKKIKPSDVAFDTSRGDLRVSVKQKVIQRKYEPIKPSLGKEVSLVVDMYEWRNGLSSDQFNRDLVYSLNLLRSGHVISHIIVALPDHGHGLILINKPADDPNIYSFILDSLKDYYERSQRTVTLSAQVETAFPGMYSESQKERYHRLNQNMVLKLPAGVEIESETLKFLVQDSEEDFLMIGPSDALRSNLLALPVRSYYWEGNLLSAIDFAQISTEEKGLVKDSFNYVSLSQNFSGYRNVIKRYFPLRGGVVLDTAAADGKTSMLIAQLSFEINRNKEQPAVVISSDALVNDFPTAPEVEEFVKRHPNILERKQLDLNNPVDEHISAALVLNLNHIMLEIDPVKRDEIIKQLGRLANPNGGYVLVGLNGEDWVVWQREGDRLIRKEMSPFAEEWLGAKREISLDKAMKVQSKTGGIDLTESQVETIGNDQADGIQFHVDSSVLSRLQEAEGFYPVINGMEQMQDGVGGIERIKVFLGIDDTSKLNLDSSVNNATISAIN